LDWQFVVPVEFAGTLLVFVLEVPLKVLASDRAGCINDPARRVDVIIRSVIISVANFVLLIIG
jgi:hypothetical protein